MRYYMLAALTLFIVGCSETSTGPDSKPFQVVVYYELPGCGPVYVKGGTADPYVRIEPGQTVTVGFDQGYRSYPGGIIPNKVDWEKVGDNTVRGSFTHYTFADKETWYDTVRCTP